MMTIQDVKLLDLPKICDSRGNLSFLENNAQIPFEIKRVYWIYDVPGGEDREAHAFRENQELIIALSGAFDILVDDGLSRKKYTLNRSHYGLYIPQGIWRVMDNFSTNALALELASTKYNTADYIIDYEEYRRLREAGEI